MLSKSRIFDAESREAAEEAAERYFGLGKENILFETIDGQEGIPGWRLFAFSGTNEELRNIDAAYKLYYEDDGVYLELYNERGAGEPADRIALSQYLARKRVTQCGLGEIQNLLQKRFGRVRIAPPQQEFLYGEDLLVETTRDESEASAVLLEPEEGGAPLGIDDAKDKIVKAGVTSGLVDEALRALLKDKAYGESRVIALAVQPVNGEDGKLLFHFDTDKKTAKPREIEWGRVDYRTLDLFEPVSEGDLLVSKVPATEGTPGVTVKGRVMKQKPGKPMALPKGKNVIINADKSEMHSKQSGYVELVNGQVNVSNLFKVDADVDMGVGNIDFDGSIQVVGNVRSGFTLKATGRIIIGGVVEGSTLIAGGSVEIKRGMQGMDKGRIEAGGNIIMQYMERGTAVANGSITIDAAIHSRLEAGESLIVKGKRGSIVGGSAVAGKEIRALCLGAVSHIQTDIEVGILPQKRARLSFIEKELERLSGEFLKLDQLDSYLSKSRGKLDPETYDKLYRSGAQNRRVYAEMAEEYTQEKAVLMEDMEHAGEGKVHVFDTAYAGVRITISTDTYRVNADTEFATFKFRDSRVVWDACEIRKN